MLARGVLWPVVAQLPLSNANHLRPYFFCCSTFRLYRSLSLSIFVFPDLCPSEIHAPRLATVPTMMGSCLALLTSPPFSLHSFRLRRSSSSRLRTSATATATTR
ncbi:hypothetical protein BGZ61DRAFT_462920 [Ilyonectria robusta]|uniref:uncharacterized protein n=1 Tax=Ilyonectria robusta TaxID=1079257 RepID=UPI001E8D387F|nr:uncharacterized protein BGZ61DRAFT_462920 [Ilyonectria robusta]KAH8662642.1 hypothetical protein BGZ61DRAFT_462920 [Ilyonectria robusta]